MLAQEAAAVANNGRSRDSLAAAQNHRAKLRL
jgi:hypothetical protein